MSRKSGFLIAVLLACVVLVLSPAAYADAPSPAAANSMQVEVTINSAGEVTAGGVYLAALGVGQLDLQAIQVIKTLDNVHLVSQGNTINLDIQGMPALKIEWSSASRKTMADLAAQYGFYVTPEVMARIEEWIPSANLDFTARYTNDVSKPAVVSVSKPVWIDLGPDGQLAIEKGALANGIDSTYVSMIKQSGAKNATVCWNKGTLVTQVDGKALPALTVYAKGLQVLSQTLNLQIEKNVDPILSALVGADISLPGGSHQANFACGQ